MLMSLISQANDYGLYFAVAFTISEALAQIPAVKANSVFQLVRNALGAVTGLVKKA